VRGALLGGALRSWGGGVAPAALGTTAAAPRMAALFTKSRRERSVDILHGTVLAAWPQSRAVVRDTGIARTDHTEKRRIGGHGGPAGREPSFSLYLFYSV
jgi:hypothetical protein